jgi:serine protease Do
MPAHDFGEISERLRRSTVHIRGTGSGSGVIWSPEGLVVTNAHVALEERSTVELWNGRTLHAALESRDRHRDLAALRLETSEPLAAASAGDSDALRPGELVIAVGNPLGFTGALSTGVVHAVGPLRGLGRRKWVQANVRLLPGNSGGPLADAHGRVIGINTMVAGRLALAVPSNAVAEFLRTGGSDVSLGVVVQPVVEGLLVLRVVPGSAAETASLLVGDLLVGINGRPFESPDDLADALSRNSGAALNLSFLRGDRRVTRQVTVKLPARRMAAEAA